MSEARSHDMKVDLPEGFVPGLELDEAQEALANEALERRVAEEKAKGHLPARVGLTRDDEGEDVVRLQAYLARFGYMASPVTEAFGVESDAVAAPPEQVGKFDESTEAALRRYQKFFGLAVTGVLDEATVDSMARPRCGNPDISREKFVLFGHKWGDNPIRWAFESTTSDLTGDQCREAIRAAFSIWSSVTPLNFVETGNNPHIRIRFVSGSHNCVEAFDNAGSADRNVLAHAFHPGQDRRGQVHFDEFEKWTLDPAKGIDLITVAAHEFGHALGLNHSEVTNALMAPNYGSRYRSLHVDDASGMVSLYGERPAPYWHDWAPLHGRIHGAPGAVISGQWTDLYVRGIDDRLHQKWSDTITWSDWVRHDDGPVLGSEPVVVSKFLSHRDVYVRGSDGAVWHKWWLGSGWSGWENLGGGIQGPPGVVVPRGTELTEIYARGMDNGLWQCTFSPSSGWGGWMKHGDGAVLGSAPTVVSNGTNHRDVYIRGTDGAVWHKWWNGSAWSRWESLGGEIQGHPGVVLPGGGPHTDIYVRGMDNALWQQYWDPSSGWSGWFRHDGILSASPTVVSYGRNHRGIYVRGRDGDVHHKWWGS